MRAVPDLLDGVACGALIGDKGYDADALIERLRQAGVDVVIPPKDNRAVKRACDYVLYKERNLIERLFQKMKQFRAITTRYDKLATNFLGPSACDGGKITVAEVEELRPEPGLVYVDLAVELFGGLALG